AVADDEEHDAVVTRAEAVGRVGRDDLHVELRHLLLAERARALEHHEDLGVAVAVGLGTEARRELHDLGAGPLVALAQELPTDTLLERGAADLGIDPRRRRRVPVDVVVVVDVSGAHSALPCLVVAENVANAPTRGKTPARSSISRIDRVFPSPHFAETPARSSAGSRAGTAPDRTPRVTRTRTARDRRAPGS